MASGSPSTLTRMNPPKRGRNPDLDDADDRPRNLPSTWHHPAMRNPVGEPLPPKDLPDGEDVVVHSVGRQGDVQYRIKRRGTVYWCSCPSWKQRGQRPNMPSLGPFRTCKHLLDLRGEAAERARLTQANARGAAPLCHPSSAVQGPCSTTSTAGALSMPQMPSTPRTPVTYRNPSTAIPGLHTFVMPAADTQRAQREVADAFARRHFTSMAGDSDKIDLGVNFDAAFVSSRWEPARYEQIADPDGEFLATRRLMTDATWQAMRLPGFPQPPPGARLNVIIHRYTPHQSTPFHVDLSYFFCEPVFGLVLRAPAHSSRHLQFRQDGVQIPLAEEDGLCFAMVGDARYKWKHGVLGPGGSSAGPETSREAEDDVRISVTWRWVFPEFLPILDGFDPTVPAVCDTLFEYQP